MNGTRLVLRLTSWLMTAVLALGLVAVISLFVLPRLLGWDLIVVQSGSMEPALPVGSLMFVQPADPEAIAVGDMISYRPPQERDANIQVTHRVVEVLDQEGSLAFRTKGDANEDPDTYLVTADNVRGKVRWHLPWLGYIAERLRTSVGFLGLILLPGGIIILTEAANIFRQLRGGGQGGGSGGRRREPGERGKSRPPFWLTVLGLLALMAAVGTLRRPTGRKARPPKTVTAAARWRWAWLGCLLVLVVGTAALWASGSQALFMDSETSYENSVEAATDLNPGPECEGSIAQDDGDVGADDADEQGESTPDEDVNAGEGVAANYEIRRGDSLTGIAARFGTTVEALAELNGLEDPDVILYGSTLNVPYVGEELGDVTADVSP